MGDEIGCLNHIILRSRYRSGELSPSQLVRAILNCIESNGEDGIWTSVVDSQTAIARASWLEDRSETERKAMPLWGFPFSVKDCIDVKDTPTTCACPDFAYIAQHTNPAVQQLLDAGAIYLGKTNLDQFATGLVGTRTGYSIPVNPFNAEYITGGSSSGAAVSVATGLVSFAIGTDTGGSGRIPAGFNNVVGLKPTRGLLSTSHMVPACRTLDCVSVFALTAEDALDVINVAKGFDCLNPFSRPEQLPPAKWQQFLAGQSFQFGVPTQEHRNFFGNREIEQLFGEAIATLTKLGGQCVEIDYSPFLEVNDLLFQGAWAAERYAAVGEFLESHPHSATPVTTDIILASKQIPAHQAFSDHYRLADLQRKLQDLWTTIDVFVVPTAGTAYSLAEIQQDPVSPNFNLGYYTNFLNLLDLAAIAVPNGFQSDGVPTGITMVAPPWSERYLSALGAEFRRRRVTKLGATDYELPVEKMPQTSVR
ncbi:MAG: allophanate hydrolase [Synechococcus sp.]